jgi:hypothetical protein
MGTSPSRCPTIEKNRDDPVFRFGIVVDHAEHAIAKRCNPAESPNCTGLVRVGLRENRASDDLRDPFL